STAAFPTASATPGRNRASSSRHARRPASEPPPAPEPPEGARPGAASGKIARHAAQGRRRPMKKTPGARLREAVADHRPLQVVGTITAFAARMAERAGHRAIYLSGGGLAANSLGMPDLGISGLEDLLVDVRRITDASSLPLLVDADTGFGSAFNIARTVRSLIKAGAAGMHIEDQVAAKRCGHRPNKALVPRAEMVDRIKAAVDARTDDFVIMARTDAVAAEGMEAAIERACACVEAGADMIFPEAL